MADWQVPRATRSGTLPRSRSPVDGGRGSFRVGVVSVLLTRPATWPVFLGKPGTRTFASIAGIEALVRGSMLSVFPLLMYRAWGSAVAVSQMYFLVGLMSLLVALGVPWLTSWLSRRKVYLGAIGLYVLGALLGLVGGKWVALALLCHATGVACAFVCFNAYVLDLVYRDEFSRLESQRLLYAATGWVAGPFLGVWLLGWAAWAPFVLPMVAASLMWWVVQRVQLGEGRAHTLMRSRSQSPWRNVQRFAAQPRLVAGWFFAVMRSCGWWFYFVYVGIFAVQNGLGEQVGGIAASLANMGLFLAPLMFRWMKHTSVRAAVRVGALFSGLCFVLAAAFSTWPWVTLVLLGLGTLFLVLLDVAANLPFMLSVKPSEREAMSSVFSSFRDVSGILSPALAWLVLLVSPVVGVFAVGGLGLIAAWRVAGALHPRLGAGSPAHSTLRRSGSPPGSDP